MGQEPPAGGNSRLLRYGIGAAALGALLIYNSVDAPSTTATPVPAVAAASPTAGAAAAAVPSAKPTRTAKSRTMPRSAPTRVRIPQIAVDAPITDLTLDANGQLGAPPPDNRNLVGWYRDGATPGEAGSAVLAGHVDTKTGPAVFLLLRLLIPGNTVEVTRADGTVASFTVDSVETFAKNAFPDDRVYADTRDAQLRLITCGGSYDRKAKDYTSNVVVFAHLT